MTEEQEKIARYDLRQRGKELQRRLATVKAQLDQYASAWRQLSDTFRNADHDTFESTSGEVRVSRPDSTVRLLPGQQPVVRKIAAVPLSYFDAEGLVQLLSDLEQTKQTLASVRRQCEEMGDPL